MHTLFKYHTLFKIVRKLASRAAAVNAYHHCGLVIMSQIVKMGLMSTASVQVSLSVLFVDVVQNSSFLISL